MALTPEEQQLVDDLHAFNSRPYDPVSNPQSLAHPATPRTFPAALGKTADALGAIGNRLEGLGVGHFTISENEPSGGQDGDVWFQVPA